MYYIWRWAWKRRLWDKDPFQMDEEDMSWGVLDERSLWQSERRSRPNPKVSICIRRTRIFHLYFRHPVISTFLWRKWQSISNNVRQNLRTSAIFTITASRAILTAYDVKLSNPEAIDGNIVKGNITSKSCHYQNNWLWSPTVGFNLDLGSRSDHVEFGFWITAALCLWLLLLILRWIKASEMLVAPRISECFGLL